VLHTVIRVAYGTAQVLGLVNSRAKVEPTTAHLMICDDCMFDCAFCAQARNVKEKMDKLSRVLWPRFDEGEVFRRLEEFEFRRVCLQVVSGVGYMNKTLGALRKLKETLPGVPVSVSARVSDMRQLSEMFLAGADRVGISIDVVDPRKYGEIKGGDFDAKVDFVKRAAEKFPGKITTHLMVGMGETEKQMVEIMKDLYDSGAEIGLFAFTPVEGTRMEKHETPGLRYYRRMQAARYLMRKGLELEMDGDTVVFDELDALEPRAFMTSGCEGCNRPCYNERPSEVPYNYPRELEDGEFQKAREMVK
jgi:biotin synthase-related radical SAM superfamily protein